MKGLNFSISHFTGGKKSQMVTLLAFTALLALLIVAVLSFAQDPTGAKTGTMGINLQVFALGIFGFWVCGFAFMFVGALNTSALEATSNNFFLTIYESGPFQ